MDDLERMSHGPIVEIKTAATTVLVSAIGP